MAEWRRDPLLPLRRPAIARPTKVLTSSSNEINVTSHSLPRLIDFQPQVSTFTPANIDDKNDTDIKHGVKIDVRFELDTHNGNVDYKELQFPKMSTATKTGVPAVETRMAAAKKKHGICGLPCRLVTSGTLCNAALVRIRRLSTLPCWILKHEFNKICNK